MIKGDKIRLKAKMGVFDNIGEVCEVTDISDGGVICFKFGIESTSSKNKKAKQLNVPILTENVLKRS